MRFNIITIFPNLFDSFLSESLISRALKSGLIDINIHDLRDFTQDKHHQVDGRPFGGGPGMVLMIEPIYKALYEIKSKEKNSKTLLLSPTGKQFNQSIAEDWAAIGSLTLLAGRYEGIDARVKNFIDESISVGPYITNGGELPAMTVIETVSRLLPGFLGNPTSLKEKSDDQLAVITEKQEYPVYTRPELFTTNDNNNLAVPKELLSGDHKTIKQWREQHSQKQTHATDK